MHDLARATASRQRAEAVAATHGAKRNDDAAR
jgi:hypothetical protein